MDYSWDFVLLGLFVVVLIIVISAIIFFWKYFLFAIIAVISLCAIVGAFIALILVVNVLVEAHKMTH